MSQELTYDPLRCSDLVNEPDHDLVIVKCETPSKCISVRWYSLIEVFLLRRHLYRMHLNKVFTFRAALGNAVYTPPGVCLYFSYLEKVSACNRYGVALTMYSMPSAHSMTPHPIKLP